jgi:glucokinase
MKSILTGDIGGTNARFVLFRDGVYQSETFRAIPVAEYTDLADAIEAYLNQVNCGDIEQASFSFASTHEYQDNMELTNSDLSVSVSGLVKRFDLQRARVVNDFTAAAVGVISLPDSCLQVINEGKPERYGPKAVIGPGTGLGVSGLVYTGEYWLPLQSQGGHVSMAAQTPRELQIYTVLEKKYGHVSAERYLSGIGTVDVYRAICQVDGLEPVFERAAQISQAAIDGQCDASGEAMELFCKWLGVISGNLAVTLGATGGIYIAGGIVPRLGDYFLNSSFRHWLFNKGRFEVFVEEMPVTLVQSGEPALYGTYTCLQKHYDLFGFTATR